MAQAIGHLPSNSEALSSNPSNTKKERKNCHLISPVWYYLPLSSPIWSWESNKTGAQIYFMRRQLFFILYKRIPNKCGPYWLLSHWETRRSCSQYHKLSWVVASKTAFKSLSQLFFYQTFSEQYVEILLLRWGNLLGRAQFPQALF
jgi:hypothetical protein